ncbi:MAG: NrfD/PsrC family molybdoenzyme membrane anchor subunit [Solirubrobacteraceae bacterium]
MSSAEVTRDGLGGVRPGREARTWSHDAGGPHRDQPRDHPGSSYYGMSVINPPVWEELDIAGYLFAGGLAGASSILAAGAQFTDRPCLAARSKKCATAAIGVSLLALIHDLGRPARFINMLRVFKPTSPMSVGTWILSAYAPLNMAATASDLLGLAPRTGRAAGAGAGLLGAAVSTYTATLIGDTAVPTWHGAHRELPFLFAGSAASTASGYGLIAAPLDENAPARRMGALGATAEMIAGQLMERRLGMVAQTLHTGTAGKRMTAAKVLSAGGTLGAATVAGRSRVGAALSGAALLAGSALTRFGLFAAGMESARDPKYTVEPQRERLSARAQHSDP